MANVQKRPNGKWRARYRDQDGREHSSHFDRKVDAYRWLDEVTARSNAQDLWIGFGRARGGRTFPMILKVSE